MRVSVLIWKRRQPFMLAWIVTLSDMFLRRSITRLTFTKRGIKIYTYEAIQPHQHGV